MYGVAQNRPCEVGLMSLSVENDNEIIVRQF